MPSLYDEALRLLRGAATGACGSWYAISRNPTKPEAVTAAGACISTLKRTGTYELAEQLVDLDYRFQLWRSSI
jgi:tryptophan 2,3-dioxygenase